ncbi:hypothetical protein HMPREF1552_01304, partial [Leptotrichia sp. oral taxon 879 str. F0557]
MREVLKEISQSRRIKKSSQKRIIVFFMIVAIYFTIYVYQKYLSRQTHEKNLK